MTSCALAYMGQSARSLADLENASVKLQISYPNGTTVTPTTKTGNICTVTFTRDVPAVGTYTVAATNVTRINYSYDPA